MRRPVVNRSASACRPRGHWSSSRKGSCLRPGFLRASLRPSRTPWRKAFSSGARTSAGMAARPWPRAVLEARAATARPGGEMRHHAAGIRAPCQVSALRPLLPAGPAPGVPLRLQRRRGPAGQITGRRRHRGIPASAAQLAPQGPDLLRQRHQARPHLADRSGLLLQQPRLLRDHRVPRGARRATRSRKRQNGHNQPPSPSADGSRPATPGRRREQQSQRRTIPAAQTSRHGWPPRPLTRSCPARGDPPQAPLLPRPRPAAALPAGRPGHATPTGPGPASPAGGTARHGGGAPR